MLKTLPALPWSYIQFTSSWNQHCLWKSRLNFFSSTPLNKTLKLSLLHPTCLHLMCRNASFSQWESTCVQTKGLLSIQLKSTEFQNSNTEPKMTLSPVPMHSMPAFMAHFLPQFAFAILSYTVKEKQPMVINIYRYSYNDSNYSEEGKPKEKNRITQLSFGLSPLLFLFLASQSTSPFAAPLLLLFATK